MTTYLDEAQVEIVTVDYFRELGYDFAFGPDIAPDGEASEREDFEDAAHGRHEHVNREDVEDMIKGIERFLGEYLG